MHRIMLIVMMLALLVAPAAITYAGDTMDGEDGTAAEEQAWEEMAELPPLHYVLEPEFSAHAGARIVDIRGSRRAGEYDYLKTRPVLGFKLHYSPLPHRLDMEFDFKNEKDMIAEFDYAYRDLFILDYNYRGLWHNLGHLRYRELPVNGSNSWTDLNPGIDYGVEINDHRLYTRLKWPNEPYHLYADLRDFTKDGRIQQRYLVGRFGAAGLRKFSQTREIDWNTRTYKAGVNGHFGPVEAEFQHGLKDFRADSDKSLINAYPAASGRPAGSFRHNQASDTQRDWDTVKLHTTNTGRIAGTLTLTSGEKRNTDGGSHAEFDRISTGWTFIPAEGVAVSVRYRHDRLEVENPDTVTERDALTGAFARTLAPVDSISRDTDVAHAAVKYSPTNNMNVKAEYTFENVDRKKERNWIDPLHGNFIPGDTKLHTTKITVWARPARSLDFRVSGIYSYSPDPSYAVSYRSKLAANAKVNWNILPGLNMNTYYKMSREENPFDFAGQTNDRDRQVKRDNAGAVLSWMPISWLNTAAYYDYSRLKIKHTTTFETNAGVPFVERGTPYRDTSHVYGVSADTAFNGAVNFTTDFHQSFSRGRFFYTAVGPADNRTKYISHINNLKLRETGGSVGVLFSIPKGWGVSANYTVNDFKDLDPQPQTGSLDGTAHSGMVMLSKTWN